MKKMMILLLSAVLLLSLCACGGEAPETTAPTVAATTPSEETTTAPVADTTAPADRKALAESCIDKSLDELIALIGEPQSSDYAPSCLNPGVGEDGNLYYDGFTVYTYREGDTETVTYVE